MKKSKKIFFYIYTIFTILVLISVLTASTYAWFSGGKTVDTTRVTSRTMDEEVELILAGTIGGAETDSAEMVPAADPAVMKARCFR